VSVFTQRRIALGQPLQHGVEGADEQEVPQLHDRQPHKVQQEKPGEDTLPEALLRGRRGGILATRGGILATRGGTERLTSTTGHSDGLPENTTKTQEDN